MTSVHRGEYRIRAFLASRGYAVLQPQFRGSTGYGEAHRLAGYRQWGRLMQDDVTDGVKALIEQGSVDPKRVCIVGASYVMSHSLYPGASAAEGSHVQSRC